MSGYQPSGVIGGQPANTQSILLPFSRLIAVSQEQPLEDSAPSHRDFDSTAAGIRVTVKARSPMAVYAAAARPGLQAHRASFFCHSLRHRRWLATCCRARLYVAQNTSGRSSAIDGRTTRHGGYAISQRIPSG